MSYEPQQYSTYPPANSSYAEAGGLYHTPPLTGPPGGENQLAPLESPPPYPVDGSQQYASYPPLDPQQQYQTSYAGMEQAQQLPPPLTSGSDMPLGPMGSLTPVVGTSSEITHGAVGMQASRPLVIIPLCRKGDRAGIEKQLQAGARIDEVDIEGNTPLHVAAEAPKNELATVQCLLEHGANANALNYIGASPLHYVCLRKSNHRGVANILLENGAQINQQTVQGKSALHFACENSLKDLVEALCLFGADCNLCDVEGNMPGHMTVLKDGGRDTEKKEILTHLANFQAQFIYANCSGMTPVHLACQNGYIRCLQYFFDAGVDVRVVNLKGQNGIHLACLHNRAEALQLLLSVNPTGVDMVDGEGNTPLHLCALVGSLDCALLLLKMDANTTLRNAQKKTAFDLSKLKGTDLNSTHNPELVQVLKDANKSGSCRQS